VIAIAQGVVAFYDIDTPVTLSALRSGACEYLEPALIPEFDCYLSFTGGPTLHELTHRWNARDASAFYCMVDEHAYRPADTPERWALGYLGTYSADRQSALDARLFQPARQRPSMSFVVGGPQFPDTEGWPSNVAHIEHVAPPDHPAFYSAQRFTLNVTRAAMLAAGWSPSVRLFEAAACGVPIISDRWAGIESFFVPGEEIVLAESTADVLAALDGISDERRAAIGAAARRRVLAEHTAERRALQLEGLVARARATRSGHR
jgi:spore maturation protein CgeB